MVPSAVVSSGWSPLAALAERLGQIALMIGMMAVGFILIVGSLLRARELYGRGDSAGANQRTNCPSCGARIPADADTCDHCGDPVEASSP